MKRLSIPLLILSIFLFSFQTQKPIEKTVTLTFTVDEVQLIYDALGFQAANKVETLRMKIALEVNKQLSDTTKVKPKN